MIIYYILTLFFYNLKALCGYTGVNEELQESDDEKQKTVAETVHQR